MNLNKARMLAIELMKEHDLFSSGYRFVFSDSPRRFGYCNYVKKIISISKPLTLVNEEHHVRDTILHEIAHAIAGRGTGHGPEWKAVAKEIGCNAQRLYDAKVVTQPRMKYTVTCLMCRTEYQQARMSKGLKRGTLYCRDCVRANKGDFAACTPLQYTINKEEKK